MSIIKVYKKRGKTTYKEDKLIKALQGVLDKKIQADPNFKFDIAHSFDELKYLHDTHCIEEAQIISETPIEKVKPKENESVLETEDDNDTKNKTDMSEKKDDVNNSSEGDGDFKFEEPDFQTPDPFNNANPKVRDYVLKDSMSPDGQKHEIGSTTKMDEPTNHAEAFAFPDDYEDKKGDKKQNTNSNEPKEQKPFNPGFDEMSGQKKVKQTKRFAKYIVETVAVLLEHGYVWWTTKDINESALAGYELGNEMDLSLLLSMSEDQQMTVKEFFAAKCAQAKDDAKISIEDKEELSDALADVLMEKGIAPTPMQTLIMVSLKIVGGQVMKAVISKGETSAVLMQLRAMQVEAGAEGPQISNAQQHTQERTNTSSPVREERTSSRATQHDTEEEEEDENEEELAAAKRQIENLNTDTVENNTNMSPVIITGQEDDDN